MFGRPKALAPEPYFTASLQLLYAVAIHVRALTARPEYVTKESIHEIYRLMDAIHNIPASLVAHQQWCGEETRAALERLDETCAGSTEFRWSAKFEKFMRAARDADA